MILGVTMKSHKYSFIVLTFILLLFYVPPFASAEKALLFDEYVEPDTYFPLDMTSPEELDIEWTISSDKNIDIIFLTMEQFDNCCSEDTTDYINSNDERNKYSKKEYTFVLKSKDSEIIVVLDNSEVVPGGATPSGPVSIKVYAEEHYEYKFQFLGFLAGSLSLILIFFGTYVSIGNNDIFSKLEQNQAKITNVKSKFVNYLNDNQETFHGKYPVLTFLMLVNIFAFVIAVILGTDYEGATISQGLNMGATSTIEIAEGDFFSLIGSNFMHWDWQHLLFNMLSFYFLGRYVEEELGSFRFFWFALFTGVCSALLGLLDAGIVGGASGIAFALIGVIFSQIAIGKYKKIESYCRYPDMSYFWYVFIGNVALIPFVSQDGIAVFGHLGGFASGFGIGLYLFHAGRPNTNAETLNALQISKFISISKENQITVENYEQLPLGGKYVYYGQKIAYLDLDNYLYVKHDNDKFTLEKWLPKEEE